MPPQSQYSYQVGSLYGRAYTIVVRCEPSLDDVESFAAVLYYESGDGERTEIARIDDSEHADSENDIHIDRLYREKDAEKKDYDINVDGPYEADNYLSERWERFAQRYQTNHGE